MVKNKKQYFLILVVFFAAIGIIGAGCLGSNDDNKTANGTNNDTGNITNNTKNNTTNNSTSTTEKTNSYAWSITFNEAYVGPEIANMMKNENMFNEVPNSSQEAVLVLITVTNNKPEYSFSNSSYFYGSDVYFMGNDGIRYPSVSAVMPKSYPKIQSGEMYPGESVKGWVYFIVPSSALADDTITIGIK